MSMRSSILTDRTKAGEILPFSQQCPMVKIKGKLDEKKKRS